MNKKIIAFIVGAVVIAVGCIGFFVISSNNNKTESNNNSNTNTTENENSNETQEENTNDNDNNNGTTNDKKVAIIYFSATGTTEKVAGYIKEVTDGDLIEIVPKDEYTSADLNYNNNNNNSRSTKEQNDSSARPEIKNTINTDHYDVIFLGYPIWWGDAPRIILTFLDSHNLDGKTVIPFCTSGGSGISSSVSYFKSHYKNVNFEDGATLNNGEAAVKNWVKGLNY